VTDVLAVAPHPDDIEIAAGGTIALLSGAKRTVVLLDLTRGERSTRGNPELRAREAAAAAKALGATARESLELPDGGLDARDPGQMRLLVEAIRRHRPRLVVAMHWNDDHPDHIEAGEMVRRAIYLARLRNYPAPGQAPHRTERTLFAMGRRPFRPGLVVDVTSTYPAKRLALEAFQSQFHREPDDPLVTPISDPEFLPRIEGRDRYFGGMIGATFGEPFFEIGPSAARGATDLLGDEAR
jgi:bacillithiol biosynthesis deacetylase BshB1